MSRNSVNVPSNQGQRACFRTPPRLNDKAQGKRSAALSKKATKSSTPTGLHKGRHRRSMMPFQGMARKASRTQGGAALALGFGMKPRWGKRPDPRIAAYQGRCTRTRARSELSMTAQRTLLTRASRDDGGAPVSARALRGFHSDRESLSR